VKLAFIVGAGASKDLNGSFPIGPELAESIESHLSKELEPATYGPIGTAIMRSMSGLLPDHLAAMSRIRDSILSEDSIDDFLSAWNDVPLVDEVAKLAIAYLILDAERRSALYIDAVTDADRTTRLRQFNSTWLGRIIRRPDKPRRDVRRVLESISFVVFNYDRMVEQYLKLYFIYVLAMSADQADALLNDTPIVHTYGSLGDITQRVPVPFGATDQFINMAATSIRTYNESHPDETVSRVRQTVRAADKVIFLGCAFHDQNLRLLFGDSREPSPQKQILGTCLGMPERRQREVIRLLSDHGSVTQLAALTCSDFVRDYDDAIFYS
jgi:hypothetical protein